MKKNILKKEIKAVLTMLCASVISFVSLHVFVIPSNFSPSGIDGVSTILYELTGINIGWFKIIINLPLMILALKFLKRRYVIFVIIFTALDSLGTIFLDRIGFYTFIPGYISMAEAVGYRLIASIFSGVMLGVCTALMLKTGCSTGGVDIIAGLINIKYPAINIERIISILCYIIIGCSYFVYHDLTSILLSVIQIFVFEWTVSSLLRHQRFAAEIKIITKQPEKIRDAILYNHGHSATILSAEGMFSGEGYYMVITVMNTKRISEFMNLLKQYPDTFIYFNDGVRVQGDFHFGDHDNKRITVC